MPRASSRRSSGTRAASVPKKNQKKKTGQTEEGDEMELVDVTKATSSKKASKEVTSTSKESSTNNDLADAILPFVMVFGGCCLAMLFFEKALKQDPGSSNFLTFTELVFIAAENAPRRIALMSSSKKLVASKKDHLTHAALFVSMSWLVNYAFSWKIAVPIHTIVRSCNVVATLLLGYFIFGLTYSRIQCIASVLVTVGILVGTFADAKVVGECSTFACLGEFQTSAEIAVWSVGVGILLLCLVMQSTLGHLQRRMYDPYLASGKISKNDLAEEFLYTSSLASLLGCVVFREEIVTHWGNAFASPAVDIFGITQIPCQWLYILGNNVAQACCLKGVFYLSTRYSALTVNITLSVRKFFTVVFSVLWFQNPWSWQHTMAAFFVFGGGLLYSSGELLLAGLTSKDENKKRAKSTDMKKKK
ncbi:unnamed protein product [Amoebophrya sp. A25]|nr:unnamed protein product [Amoebophrya sp. A25]|eukprot:GSA25T00007987001.1